MAVEEDDRIGRSGDRPKIRSGRDNYRRRPGARMLRIRARIRGNGVRVLRDGRSCGEKCQHNCGRASGDERSGHWGLGEGDLELTVLRSGESALQSSSINRTNTKYLFVDG